MVDSANDIEERFAVGVLADIHKVVTQLYREEGKGRRCYEERFSYDLKHVCEGVELLRT